MLLLLIRQLSVIEIMCQHPTICEVPQYPIITNVNIFGVRLGFKVNNNKRQIQ